MKTLRLREQEAGKYIQQVAQESCKEASLQEKAAISPDIVASFDEAWQCRASSGAYNSKSGHAVLIGQENGKILGYGIRNRNCRISSLLTERFNGRQSDLVIKSNFQCRRIHCQQLLLP